MRALVLAAVLCSFAGCAAQGLHVRVATATPEQLKAAHDEPIVWYDFEPGDEVSFVFGFVGAAQGVVQAPAVIRAKQKFSMIMQKNFPIQFSFDGSSYARDESSQYLVGVLPGPDGKGAVVAWMNYLGESGDAQKALEELPAPAPAPQ